MTAVFFAKNLDKVNINFAILIIDKVLQGFKHDFSRTISAMVLRVFNLYLESIDNISTDHIYNPSDFDCKHRFSSRSYCPIDLCIQKEFAKLHVE